ncbi:MAG: PstS family phosphate ABC transporter substrate-binding protein [Alphaproteobacteria bacterium]|nr:MAG: PstS family phosphate ABC transporter substrate-binding protein [Alphaproteobacteria bacterium]
MTAKTFLLAAAVAAAVALPGAAAFAQGRDQIRIVGSSTVFPFTTAVAEEFGRQGRFRTPVVESTGTGGGMRLFCQGVGAEHPDFTNASRRITRGELETCTRNGVQVVEISVGFDGIVVADRLGGQNFSLTREQIWKALARQVPVNGQLVNNPYRTWNQVDPALPNRRIEVLGPPPTSGTRDSFVELVMDVGCRNIPEIRAITDNAARGRACASIREDGVFIEAGENDNLIVQRLTSSAEAMGVFGFSFYDQNRDKIKSHPIEGVTATLETISGGQYPVSRPLFVYLKNNHVGVIPGIMEFAAEYMSDRAAGSDGYLSDRGLVPMPDATRRGQRTSVMNRTVLTTLN